MLLHLFSPSICLFFNDFIFVLLLSPVINVMFINIVKHLELSKVKLYVKSTLLLYLLLVTSVWNYNLVTEIDPKLFIAFYFDNGLSLEKLLFNIPFIYLNFIKILYFNYFLVARLWR